MLGLLLQLLLLVELGHAAALNTTMRTFDHSYSDCQTKREEALGLHNSGLIVYVPTCSDDGNYAPRQCSGSTGFCWCVNIYTGAEIPGTKTPPGSPLPRCGEWRYPPPPCHHGYPPPAPPSCYHGYLHNLHLVTVVTPFTSTLLTVTSTLFPLVECMELIIFHITMESHTEHVNSLHPVCVPVCVRVRTDCSGDPYNGDCCPTGWSRYGTRCFIFIEGQTDWIQAQVRGSQLNLLLPSDTLSLPLVPELLCV